VLDEGGFDVTGAGRVDVEMPDLAWLGTVVEARAPGRGVDVGGLTVPLARAASGIVWRRRAAVALGAAVVDDALPLRWEVPDEVRVRVEVGACAAEATLPEGQGELRAVGLGACGGAGPLAVRVWAGEHLWLDGAVVRVPAGGPAR
jgi:hypothetical protein